MRRRYGEDYGEMDREHKQRPITLAQWRAGIDAAALTGGAALRRQSLYGAPINYFDFRSRISRAVLAKGISMEPATLIDHSVAVWDGRGTKPRNTSNGYSTTSIRV